MKDSNMIYLDLLHATGCTFLLTELSTLPVHGLVKLIVHGTSIIIILAPVAAWFANRSSALEVVIKCLKRLHRHEAHLLSIFLARFTPVRGLRFWWRRRQTTLRIGLVDLFLHRRDSCR